QDFPKECGSCWAFASVAALESQVLRAPGPALRLSEQILVSCDTANGNDGCDGGFIQNAAAFLSSLGTPEDSMYPYAASNGTCPGTRGGWTNDAYKINSWSWVPNTVQNGDTVASIANIQTALNSYGPLPTTMVACDDFDNY